MKALYSSMLFFKFFYDVPDEKFLEINTPEFYGYCPQQKTGEVKEKYKKRSCQEWENGEISGARSC